MSLIKGNNFNKGVSRLRPNFLNLFDFDNFFDTDFVNSSLVPAVNIKENDSAFEIELAAPGRKKRDFNISVAEGLLSISSETEESKEEKEENYTRKEFSHSSFTRSFTLPPEVDEDKIKANYKDGVLTLTLAKKKGVKPIASREIKVS